MRFRPINHPTTPFAIISTTNATQTRLGAGPKTCRPSNLPSVSHISVRLFSNRRACAVRRASSASRRRFPSSNRLIPLIEKRSRDLFARHASQCPTNRQLLFASEWNVGESATGRTCVNSRALIRRRIISSGQRGDPTSPSSHRSMSVINCR